MPDFSGDVLADISTEMVRLKATLYGKGPIEVKTYQCDNMIVSVMKGPLSKAEQFLKQQGRKAQVRDFRLTFQDAARPEFCHAVERLTGHRVLTYESQILFDPDVVVELFLLGDGI